MFDPPDPSIRKVVIATNIAATSLTIEGIKLVFFYLCVCLIVLLLFLLFFNIMYLYIMFLDNFLFISSC